MFYFFFPERLDFFEFGPIIYNKIHTNEPVIYIKKQPEKQNRKCHSERSETFS